MAINGYPVCGCIFACGGNSVRRSLLGTGQVVDSDARIPGNSVTQKPGPQALREIDEPCSDQEQTSESGVVSRTRHDLTLRQV